MKMILQNLPKELLSPAKLIGLKREKNVFKRVSF